MNSVALIIWFIFLEKNLANGNYDWLVTSKIYWPHWLVIKIVNFEPWMSPFNVIPIAFEQCFKMTNIHKMKQVIWYCTKTLVAKYIIWSTKALGVGSEFVISIQLILLTLV